MQTVKAAASTGLRKPTVLSSYSQVGAMHKHIHSRNPSLEYLQIQCVCRYVSMCAVGVYTRVQVCTCHCLQYFLKDNLDESRDKTEAEKSSSVGGRELGPVGECLMFHLSEQVSLWPERTFPQTSTWKGFLRGTEEGW